MPSAAPTSEPSWAPPAHGAATPTRSVEEQFSIPTGYGDHRIVLMVKDPWWLFAYWEIQPAMERAARGELLPHEIAGLQTVLRVYDVTDVDFPTGPAHRWFDISLSGLATNWYIQTNAPGRTFVVDIGLLTNTGRFLLLARSNRVTAPRFGPSDVIDEAWMTTDELYWKLFGVSAGIGIGSSPTGWAQVAPQQLFSAGWSSGSLWTTTRPAAVKGFWCRVDTDLVIHGATEPKAKVLIQGQAAAIRKDGTFSLRLALPEGTRTITIDVTSPDGRHTRTVTPIVTLAWAGSITPDPTKTTSQLAQESSRAGDQSLEGA